MRETLESAPKGRKSAKVVIDSDEYDVEDAAQSDETVQEAAVPRKSVGAYNFGL
jgi:hypothetical protein